MARNNLVIVESPAKAKTIEKFLGTDYTVKSSFGHVRDLPKKGMSVDIANNFTPSYEVSADKKKIVSELKTAAKTAELVWLASDEDREGEAIAWHLSEVLKLPATKTKRIVFHEITKPAIEQAIKNPRALDIDLVNAQQARRILDRIVGYELSPVLWKKVRPGLSAGRVQSVAVRLIVEREREINDFKAEASFRLKAIFKLKDGTELPAELSEKIKTKDQAKKILLALSDSQHQIDDITKAPAVRNPAAPFTTSTLQQTASSRLGYSPKQTMVLAQKLYESGAITYMRTDSLNLSPLATKAMGNYIQKQFGSNYHQLRTFKAKTAGAQEAHEAIRPTDVTKTSAGSDPQQVKLYQLIWRRALASQMSTAKLEKTTIKIKSSECSKQLEAKGEVVLFDGWLKLEPPKASDAVLLPEVKIGDALTLISASATETLSRAPARYTEASLIKKLEDLGIGRPSTYAPTISTIQTRGYVIKGDIEGETRQLLELALIHRTLTENQINSQVGADQNKLLPTDTGNVVTDFLVKYFAPIIDYDFTKDVEAEFDTVADGKEPWQQMLSSFYGPFHNLVESSDKISRAEAAQARKIGLDPKSGKPVSARYGRFGPMVQIGDKDDDEKPEFASIPKELSVETISLEQALKLFELPRVVGTTDNGEEITANIGRFGPYIKIGSTFVSIKGHDPHHIDQKTAEQLYKEKLAAEAAKNIADFGDGIKVLNGPYGPYITDGKKNARIAKDQDPAKISHQEAKKILAEAPARKGRFRRRTNSR